MNCQNSHPRIINALSIDVEDYYQVSAFEDVVKRDAWDDYESRVCQNTYRLLQLLEKHDAKATFFVLGWVAQRFPELVQNIFAEGHEIGCHGYWHQLIYHLTPDQFQTDLRMATSIIEDASGHKVESYRAPSFSIVEQSLWALDVLIDEGYRYDSSIFPIRHDRYGLPGADRFPHRIQRSGGAICEFPLTVHTIGKYNLPIAGGGYFRFFPTALSIRWLRRVNEKHGQPFIFYIHPWEIQSSTATDCCKTAFSIPPLSPSVQDRRQTQATVDRVQIPNGWPDLKKFRLASSSQTEYLPNRKTRRTPC